MNQNKASEALERIRRKLGGWPGDNVESLVDKMVEENATMRGVERGASSTFATVLAQITNLKADVAKLGRERDEALSNLAESNSLLSLVHDCAEKHQAPIGSSAVAWVVSKVDDLIRERDGARAALSARPVVESEAAKKLKAAWDEIDNSQREFICDDWRSSEDQEFGRALRAFCGSPPPSQPAPAERPVDRELAEALKAWHKCGRTKDAATLEVLRPIARRWLAAPRAPVADDAYTKAAVALAEADARTFKNLRSSGAVDRWSTREYPRYLRARDEFLAARHASGKDADQLREVTEKADPDGTLHNRIHPTSGRLLSASPVLKPAAAPARVVYVAENDDGVLRFYTSAGARARNCVHARWSVWDKPVALTPVAEGGAS